MSRMNYNRPRGGYEQEPWQKTWAPVGLPKLDPLPLREHRVKAHKIQKIMTRSGPHKAFYKCLTCNKWLCWATTN